MGGTSSKPEPASDREPSPCTAAPVVTSTPCPAARLNQDIYRLLLAFFAGVLLTLLLMAFIVFIIKSYRKCHSSPQAVDSHVESPTKLMAISEESVTYANMTFKTSEAKSNRLTERHTTDVDPIVYAPVKLTN